MSKVSKRYYEDVVDLANTDTQYDSLFGPDTITHSPVSYFSPDNQLSPAQSSSAGIAPRKRWSSLMADWGYSADFSGLVQQSMGWTHTKVYQRMISSVAGTVEVYTAAQMAAIKGLDNWMASLDEGLFVPKDATDQAAGPLYRDEQDGRASSAKESSYVSKVNLYHNSRLPPGLPLLQL